LIAEFENHYPTFWTSPVGDYRVIVSKDGLQYIVQQKQGKWRPLSYHMQYGSLVFRWSHRIEGLPKNSPNLLSREKTIRANISTAAEGKPTITIRELLEAL